MELATLSKYDWQLQDLEQPRHEHGGTFVLLSLHERPALALGQVAKLVFRMLIEDAQGASLK